MIKNDKGLLIVISGPSGVGKGTLCKQLIQVNRDVFVSISATTRQPREGEINGENYYFYELDKFKEMVSNNEFLEWAVFCDNYYGTPKKTVLDKLNQGIDVILEIDVQGALKVKSEHPEGVFIFVMPPSIDDLKNRLSGRGTEPQEIIEKRLLESQREIKQYIKYNYLVVNDTVDNAVNKINAIILAEKLRTERNTIIV